MFHRFEYEAEFYPSLKRVPLYVRMKLDLAGVKISLKDWLDFDFAERTVLCHLPCDSSEERQAFIDYLDFLSRKYTGMPISRTEPLDSALWHESKVPEPVYEKSGESGSPVTADEWFGWKFHQRYALYKTAVSKSQPEAFAKVLEQFRNNREAGS
jgi:hypothetical protein